MWRTKRTASDFFCTEKCGAHTTDSKARTHYYAHASVKASIYLFGYEVFN